MRNDSLRKFTGWFSILELI